MNKKLKALAVQHYPNWLGRLGYRCIFLAHKLVIEVEPSMERGGMEYNISELVEWILESVKEIIRQLEKGVYNRKVMEKLPAWHRTGTILRKDYWDIYPDGRKAFFASISKDDVDEFVKCMAVQRDMYICIAMWISGLKELRQMIFTASVLWGTRKTGMTDQIFMRK